MSTYAASISPTATSAFLNILPSSTYQVRIARIEFCATNTATIAGNSTISLSYGLAVYPSATLSGGSTVTPVRMLAGSPAAAATLKSGGTITGTGFTLHTETNIGTNSDSTNSITTSAQLVSNYTPATELIVANGSIVSVVASATVAATSLTLVVYFEEIRTPRTL